MNITEKLTHPLALGVFLLTLIFPVLIGFFALRRTKDQEDFFIGGRMISRFMVALSAVSSGRSSWLILGVSGIAYLQGVSAVWAVSGYILIELFQFIFIGKKLRAESENFSSITLLDYFCAKFKSPILLRLSGALILITFLTAYVGAQLNAGAKSLGSSLNISFSLALLITLGLILIYMIIGGFVAVVYNDVIRAFIMIGALLFLPAVAIIELGGINVLLKMLKALNPALIDPFSLSAGAMIGFLGIGLGSPGQPHIIVRYMAVDKAENLGRSALIGTIWNILMAWGAIFIGLAARVIFPGGEMLPGHNPEMAYIALSGHHLHPVIYGFLVGGIFAAILSTADSQLLVLASAFVRDIYEKIILQKSKKVAIPLDAKQKLALSRLVVLLSGLLAGLLAYFAQETIFWLVLFAWGGLGASFGTALIFALYWKKCSSAGLIAGMISGTTVTLVWKLWLINHIPLYELIPAFTISALSLIVFSLLFPEDKPQKTQ